MKLSNRICCANIIWRLQYISQLFKISPFLHLGLDLNPYVLKHNTVVFDRSLTHNTMQTYNLDLKAFFESCNLVNIYR